MELPEKTLIQELKSGNSKAFEVLFFRYNEQLFNFSNLIIRNKEEAEGLVQEVFISVWENRKDLDENLYFKAYLFKIAKNKALNLIKKNVRFQLYEKYIRLNDHETYNVSDNIEAKEIKDLYQKSLENLSPKTRKIFILSRNQGYTQKEIAKITGYSLNTVDHEIRKALKYIKSYI